MGEEKLDGERCPLCHQKTLVLAERETEVPYFGKVYLFSMTCSSCKYHKADVEAVERKEPCKYTFEVGGKNKGNYQIAAVPNSFVANDTIEYGFANHIPLWMFGFLY